jgi:hypothetical protein
MEKEKNKILSVNLPESWCKQLKRMSLEKSLKLEKDISVSLLVKRALKHYYSFEEGKEK